MENLEQKIMGEIESGRVTLRSRYLFIAEKLGMGSAMVLTVVLASLLVALLLWYMKDSETLSYLSFGSDGLLAFWENFPYGLLVSALLVLMFVGYLFKKSGWAYKIPFVVVIISTVATVSIIGLALSFTEVPGHLGREEFAPARPLFHPILPRKNIGRGGMTGRLVEWNNPNGTVMTPHGARTINAADAPTEEREHLQTNMMILVVGRPEEGVFMVRHIRILPPAPQP